jgi:hypothetical protein
MKTQSRPGSTNRGIPHPRVRRPPTLHCRYTDRPR